MNEDNGFIVGREYWVVSFGSMLGERKDEVEAWLNANIEASYMFDRSRGKVWCSSEEDSLMILLALGSV